MANAYQRGITKGTEDERGRCIELLKCWYDTTDFDFTLKDLVELLEGEHIEPWRKQLQNKRNNL